MINETLVDVELILEAFDETRESADPEESKEYHLSRLTKHSVLLTTFENEMENWSTWIQESHFYAFLYKQDGEELSLLVELNWDDNWGNWEWVTLKQIKSSSNLQADGWKLLRLHASENIKTAGTGGWADFLKTVLKS